VILRNWVMLFVAAVIGVLALFTASGAGGGTAYDAGLLVFVVAIGFIFFLIKRTFDQAERSPH
jgi:hypothetical protein